MTEQPTPAEMVKMLRERGLTIREIATELQRSPRMVQKIQREETSGALFAPALRSLVSRGRVQAPPPRRTRTDGTAIPVRGHGGTMVTPLQPRKTRQSPPRMNPRPTVQGVQIGSQFYPEGGREWTLQKPTGPEAHADAKRLLTDRLRSAAKAQRHGIKRIKMTFRTKDGRRKTVGQKGGVRASLVLSQVKEKDFDPIAWGMQCYDPDSNASPTMDTAFDPEEITDVHIEII